MKRDTWSVEIADPRGLADVLREAIRRQGWGDPVDPDEILRGVQTDILRAVAEASRVSRPYLHRLLNARVETPIGWGTILKLEEWLKSRERTKAQVDDLFDAILGPSAAQARREYAKYVERECKRLLAGRKGKYDIPFSANAKVEKVVRDFSTYARKIWCPPLRIRLAELRVLDPIISSPKLRQAIEADEDLYVASVKLGYKRERLLIEKELHEFHAKS